MDRNTSAIALVSWRSSQPRVEREFNRTPFQKRPELQLQRRALIQARLQECLLKVPRAFSYLLDQLRPELPQERRRCLQGCLQEFLHATHTLQFETFKILVKQIDKHFDGIAAIIESQTRVDSCDKAPELYEQAERTLYSLEGVALLKVSVSRKKWGSKSELDVFEYLLDKAELLSPPYKEDVKRCPCNQMRDPPLLDYILDKTLDGPHPRQWLVDLKEWAYDRDHWCFFRQLYVFRPFGVNTHKIKKQYFRARAAHVHETVASFGIVMRIHCDGTRHCKLRQAWRQTCQTISDRLYAEVELSAEEEGTLFEIMMFVLMTRLRSRMRREARLVKRPQELVWRAVQTATRLRVADQILAGTDGVVRWRRTAREQDARFVRGKLADEHLVDVVHLILPRNNPP